MLYLFLCPFPSLSYIGLKELPRQSLTEGPFSKRLPFISHTDSEDKVSKEIKPCSIKDSGNKDLITPPTDLKAALSTDQTGIPFTF